MKVKGDEGYTVCTGKVLTVRAGWGFLGLTTLSLEGKNELLQIHMYFPNGIV